jgi:hypothetical protein
LQNKIKNTKSPIENKIGSLRKESDKLKDSINMNIDTFKMELDVIEDKVEKMIKQIDTIKIDTTPVKSDTAVKKKIGWFKKITNKIKGKKDE